ncbi:hypothetical protein BGW38_010522, partial [Lunasporangiospora selenospora]
QERLKALPDDIRSAWQNGGGEAEDGFNSQVLLWIPHYSQVISNYDMFNRINRSLL